MRRRTLFKILAASGAGAGAGGVFADLHGWIATDYRLPIAGTLDASVDSRQILAEFVTKKFALPGFAKLFVFGRHQLEEIFVFSNGARDLANADRVVEPGTRVVITDDHRVTGRAVVRTTEWLRGDAAVKRALVPAHIDPSKCEDGFLERINEANYTIFRSRFVFRLRRKSYWRLLGDRKNSKDIAQLPWKGRTSAAFEFGGHRFPAGLPFATASPKYHTLDYILVHDPDTGMTFIEARSRKEAPAKG